MHYHHTQTSSLIIYKTVSVVQHNLFYFLSLNFSSFFLLLLICVFSFAPLLVNNREAACSTRAVNQPARSRVPAVNTYVRLVCVHQAAY